MAVSADCANKREGEPTMDQNQNAGNSSVMAVCNRKKNDKNPVIFYPDRMTFNGETILYSDVEIINVYSSSTEYNFIFETYSGYVKIKLRDGRKLKWKVGGSALFGIGKVKTKRQYFAQMFDACLATFIKTRAASYLNDIRLGGTVTIAHLTINANEITGKSGLKTITLPFSEIGGAEIVGGSVRINRIGKHLAAFNTSQSHIDNAICLLFIINSLAAGSVGNDAAPAETPAE